MLDSIKPVERKSRHFMPFEARKPRLRNTCPSCGSLNVRKRRSPQYDYRCERCGWTGQGVVKVEC